MGKECSEPGCKEVAPEAVVVPPMLSTCPMQDPATGLYCGREVGHAGHHVTVSTRYRVLAEWAHAQPAPAREEPPPGCTCRLHKHDLGIACPIHDAPAREEPAARGECNCDWGAGSGFHEPCPLHAREGK